MEIVIKIKRMIQNSLKELYDLDISEVQVDKPREFKHGDYTTNIAMQVSKKIAKSPYEIAKELMQEFSKFSDFDKVEIAGPGFINFYLNILVYQELLEDILNQDQNYGFSNYGQNKKINVEFVSANPTGSLHIGHARQASYGDSICRLYLAAGYQVTREYYVNDAGNQINNHTLSLMVRYDQLFGVNTQIIEDGYHGQDLIEIAQIIKNQVGDKYLKCDPLDKYQYFNQEGVRLQLDRIKSDLKIYRCEFDIFSSELAIKKTGSIEKVLKTLKDKGYTYNEDGATWFKTTEFGDDKNRVLIKSDGSYTYLLPDIAYHQNKMERGYDYLVDLLGADHHGYITRIKASLQALGYSSEQLEIELVQMVRLIKDGQEFKMSKRSGKAVTIIDLIDEIGVDAARYIFVSRAASSHLDVNIDLLKLESTENPVFYSQYAHARICSILENAQKLNLIPTIDLKLNTSTSERALLRLLANYQRVVLDAALTRAPYKITLYIQELSTCFHSFYGECRVIDESNIQLTRSRLSFLQSTRIILRNALKLIGVEAPVKM